MLSAAQGTLDRRRESSAVQGLQRVLRRLRQPRVQRVLHRLQRRLLQRTRLWVELADQTVPTLQAATVGAAVADPTSPGGTLLPLSLGFSEAVGGASGGALSAADLQISLRPALAELVAVEAGTIDDYVDGVLGRRRRLQPADVAAAANHSLVLVVRCCAVVAADGADTKIDEEV